MHDMHAFTYTRVSFSFGGVDFFPMFFKKRNCKFVQQVETGDQNPKGFLIFIFLIFGL